MRDYAFNCTQCGTPQPLGTACTSTGVGPCCSRRIAHYHKVLVEADEVGIDPTYGDVYTLTPVTQADKEMLKREFNIRWE